MVTYLIDKILNYKTYSVRKKIDAFEKNSSDSVFKIEDDPACSGDES